MGQTIITFADCAGKRGQLVGTMSGTSLTITRVHATKLLRKYGDNLPFDIMAANYGATNGDNCDREWSEGDTCDDNCGACPHCSWTGLQAGDLYGDELLDDDWQPFAVFSGDLEKLTK
jgi:hypothetical protein